MGRLRRTATPDRVGVGRFALPGAFRLLLRHPSEHSQPRRVGHPGRGCRPAAKMGRLDLYDDRDDHWAAFQALVEEAGDRVVKILLDQIMVLDLRFRSPLE